MKNFKKNYIKPQIEITTFSTEELMLVSSTKINSKNLVEKSTKNAIQLQ